MTYVARSLPVTTWPRISGLVGILLALCSCSGSPITGSIPVSSRQPAERVSGVTFTIRVPPAAASSQTARSAQYISPATQSMSIALVSVDGTPVTQTAAVANLTASSPGCTNTGNSLNCSVPISVPAGVDVFTLTLFSATGASGSALSNGTVSTTVAADSINTVPITLDGIVSTIAISVPAPLIVGVPATVPIAVTVKDASGATIVGPGNYQPAITLTMMYSDGHETLANAALSPGTSATVRNANATGFAITASAPGVPTQGITPAVVSINPAYRMYVSVPGGVAQYTLPLTVSSVPVFTLPVSGIAALAEDTAGNVVMGGTNGVVSYYPAPVTGTSTPAASFSGGSSAITALAAGSYIFAASAGSGVNLFSMPPSNSSVPVSNRALSSPTGMAIDRSANLYVQDSTCSITEFPLANAYQATVTTAGTNYESCQSLAVDATSQNLFAGFVENAGPGTVNIFKLPLISSSIALDAIDLPGTGSPLLAVSTDAYGQLYVVTGNKVLVYVPPFTPTSKPSLSLPGSFSGAIAIGR